MPRFCKNRKTKAVSSSFVFLFIANRNAWEVCTIAISEKRIELSHVEGFSEGIIKKLLNSGLETIDDVRDAGVDGLLKVPGIGQKTAERIMELIESVKEF